MRGALPATLIPPLIFWACGSNPVDSPAEAGVNDAGARDATSADAVGFADADDGFPDATTEADAETFPDAETHPDAAEPDGGAACAYPANPAEPMALNRVLWPYSWPEAINANGDNYPLALEQANCATDPNINWSSFGHLLFVSIPAW